MNIDLFLATLPIMAKGMLGVFIVALAIIGVVLLLNKLTTPKE